MEAITKAILIASVAGQYKQQYAGRDRDRALFGLKLTHGEHYELLRRATTEDDVEHIIGNRSWTRNKCDECQRDCEITVILGEEPGCESNTAQICLECLEKAVALARAA